MLFTELLMLVVLNIEFMFLFLIFAAAIMKNTGILFANDMNKDRGKAVVGNFHRLGVINSVICCYDGRNFSKVSIIQVKLWLQTKLNANLFISNN